MPSANAALIAAAGSGKTTRLVAEALAGPDSRVLITTFTLENLAEIDGGLWREAGGTPHNVTTMSWFEFLLREGVKPYQSYKTEILSIRSINFDSQRNRFAKKTDFDRFYVDSARNLYKDTVSELVCALDDASGGKVMARLAACFDQIFIDEVQDLAGYDLELLERLLKLGIRVFCVGDPRQGVYMTNTSAKNKGLRRAEIVSWIESKQKAGLLTMSTLSESYRCNQPICDYADGLYPDLPATASKNTQVMPDMGVHLVHVDHLDAYRTAFAPQELRWDKRNKVAGPGALNFGEVKGKSFDRVLIHPTGPMTAYVESGADLAAGARAKFYVAVTRARHSVAILTDKSPSKSGLTVWAPRQISPAAS